jgi:hypothetical protein
MLAIFYLVLYGDFLTGGFTAVWRWLARHEGLLALAASTPFFAAMLVGRASAKKARRRRAEAARAAELESPAPQGPTEPLPPVRK